MKKLRRVQYIINVLLKAIKLFIDSFVLIPSAFIVIYLLISSNFTLIEVSNHIVSYSSNALFYAWIFIGTWTFILFLGFKLIFFAPNDIVMNKTFIAHGNNSTTIKK